MIYVLLNCGLSTLLTVLLGISIIWFDHWLSRTERVGMGILGGAGLLRVPVVYYTAQDIPTPYDGWASCLFVLGAVIFFAGWMHRKRVHDLANRRMTKQYEAHRAARQQKG